MGNMFFQGEAPKATLVMAARLWVGLAWKVGGLTMVREEGASEGTQRGGDRYSEKVSPGQHKCMQLCRGCGRGSGLQGRRNGEGGDAKGGMRSRIDRLIDSEAFA